ncbi:hypothetical protein H9Q16_18685 [Sulfitobacter sp. TSTF-M16]|uniref:Uncharacterized protein n=1 Tax=Sulfitobacter aestuariivivens TaxID=2766981 RepID=A0A927D906_9RHOB|nr:hypothetical protein [Sulfitobacter aestuariivivens]
MEDIEKFVELFDPLERENLTLLRDHRTGAVFIECHILASKITSLGTTDVPLDAEASAEYRANRDVVADHAAFEQMRSDAVEGRRFSNIVAEFDGEADEPLKIIGGQHRFEAISEAQEEDVDIEHGVKVYFQLDNEQRLDVQIISNTNISVSKELLDRMFETLAGAELRDWCQKCGLLEKKQDFADKPGRSNPITVKEARSFITNYYLGKAVDSADWASRDTTPQLVESGKREPVIWRETKQRHPELWKDPKLRGAGKAFAALRAAQMAAFYDNTKDKYMGPADYRHKAKNLALLAGWAFVAGCLSENLTRLKRHYSLAEKGKSKDPLRADLLANGRHSTDPANYRGLGYRSDPKERGRFAELFWLQAEKGLGISKKGIELAIQEYEAKQANLRARAMRDKLK